MPKRTLAGVCGACVALTLAQTLALALTSTANATITTVYSSIPDGIAAFDQTVIGAGSVVLTDNWDEHFDIPDMRGGYDVSYTYGHSLRTMDERGAFPDLTGLVAYVPFFTSGYTILETRISSLEFNFNSKVNAFGLEIESWLPCCEAAGLYVSFDGGDPIRLALFDENNPRILTNDINESFVGVIDDGGQFSKVQIWGDSPTTSFYAGGTIRYALVEPPAVSPVPLPAGLWLLGSAVLGGGALSRLARKH